jgi:hypothetical protein
MGMLINAATVENSTRGSSKSTNGCAILVSCSSGYMPKGN